MEQSGVGATGTDHVDEVLWVQQGTDHVEQSVVGATRYIPC